MHRLAHSKHRLNFIHRIHLYHHKINYLDGGAPKFKWHFLFFYFGFYETIDIVLILTLPAIFVYLLYPTTGVYLLIFHYFYEVLFSEGVLDHNPKITGKITRFFAWGEYHLTHHRYWKYNFGLLITFWDFIFGTQDKNKSV